MGINYKSVKIDTMRVIIIIWCPRRLLLSTPSSSVNFSSYSFLAHLVKGNVSFCHPSSVVCHSFTSFGWGFTEEKIKMWNINGWQTTDTKWWQKFTLPLHLLPIPGQMNQNLVGSIYIMSSIKIAHSDPLTNIVSDWLISKKSSPLKPLCQMNCLWRSCLLTDRN
jgi:hypothetical protein